MIEFPYGIADFHSIRRDGMLYVDRTSFLRDVERLGRVLVLLRPRRFGKSLWLQTLANYYDLRREGEFDKLFGDLAIGEAPTPLRNRFFVLQWNFSEVDPSGDVAQVGRSLEQHVTSRVRAFAADYHEHLPGPIDAEAAPPVVLDNLLSAVRRTPYKLYLLIDEYDNFINEVMAKDADAYHSLVEADGPYRQVFKSVKAAFEGRGLERIFVTGVSPVALNDLTSGFNIAQDVSLEPALANLCGFHEDEIRDVLASIAAERELPADDVDATVEMLRTWYNGYRFHEDAGAPVYNPTNALYFLRHLYLHGKPPKQLHDQNLRTDRGKLVFLARSAAGAGVIEALAESANGTVEAALETSFSLTDLTARMGKDPNAIASFLYYLGLLTQADAPFRLKIPNLVVRKLFLDRLLEIFLPEVEESARARGLARAVFQNGELGPLVTFFEDKLLPVLSHRDQGAPPRKPGQSGGGVNETAVKSLFLAMLFDDHHYRISSELELERSYADLCLLVRDEMRHYRLFDLLFEFKLVRRKDLGRAGRAIRDLDDDALRRLAPVSRALRDARSQLERYRAALSRSPGADKLRLKSWLVVAVGLERIVSEEVT